MADRKQACNWGRYAEVNQRKGAGTRWVVPLVKPGGTPYRCNGAARDPAWWYNEESCKRLRLGSRHPTNNRKMRWRGGAPGPFIQVLLACQRLGLQTIFILRPFAEPPLPPAAAVRGGGMVMACARRERQMVCATSNGTAAPGCMHSICHSPAPPLPPVELSPVALPPSPPAATESRES